MKNERGQSTVEFMLVLPWFVAGLFMVLWLIMNIAIHQENRYRDYMEYRRAIVEAT